MFLKTSRITSGASRNIKKLTSRIFDKKPFKKLSFKKISVAGRSRAGQIVIFSKTSLKARMRTFSINYSFRNRELSFISTFTLVPYSNKLLALLFLSSGSVAYVTATNSAKLFKFNYFTPLNPIIKPWFSSPLMSLIYNLKHLARISLFEIFPGAGIKFARSPGVSAKIISFNYREHVCTVKLPSGIRKVISIYSLASQGPVALKEARRVANTKAGFWRTKGCKSMVRGVARNPVDHPHGGRTKAIKNPRTP